jgi:hypothetical protein
MARVRKPFCTDCGGGNAHVVSLPNGGSIWLCGSCEVLRNDPEAPRRKVPEGLPGTWPQRGRKGKPQKESLF